MSSCLYLIPWKRPKTVTAKTEKKQTAIGWKIMHAGKLEQGFKLGLPFISLTLKVLITIVPDNILVFFLFLFFFFRKNKACHFMWIAKTYLFSLKKKKKNRMSYATMLLSALRVKIGKMTKHW